MWSILLFYQMCNCACRRQEVGWRWDVQKKPLLQFASTSSFSYFCSFSWSLSPITFAFVFTRHLCLFSHLPSTSLPSPFFLFLDALASLDFKLSVSESLMFLQLAHLRVFQIFFSMTRVEQLKQIGNTGCLIAGPCILYCPRSLSFIPDGNCPRTLLTWDRRFRSQPFKNCIFLYLKVKTSHAF